MNTTQVKTTKTRVSKTRQPAGIPSKALAAATVAVESAKQKQRKQASKAALHAVPAVVVLHDGHVVAAAAHAKALADSAAYESALRVDAAALGLEGEAADAYVAEQLTPVPEEKQRYAGPMLALVVARAQYKPAANGNLACGDLLSQICGQHAASVTVAALIRALDLPGNPYLKLNVGQQSMNLRNKARHALKSGLLTLGKVEEAYAVVAK